MDWWLSPARAGQTSWFSGKMAGPHGGWRRDHLTITSYPEKGVFTIRSIYAFLMNNSIRVSQDIWRAKLPMKIKVFMRYLKRRGGGGCHSDERQFSQTKLVRL